MCLEQLFGNTEGLGSADSKALRALYKRSVLPSQFLSPALARELCQVTQLIGRRVGILVDRKGRVDSVIVGDAHRVFLPDLGARRAGAARFRGVRLVLSTIRPQGVTEEDLTDLTLLQLDAVIVVQMTHEGEAGSVQYAYLLPPKESDKSWQIERRRDVHNWDDDWTRFIVDLEQRFTRSPHLKKVKDRERAICIGVTLDNPRQAKRGMRELEQLAETAGFDVVDTVLQPKKQIDGRTFIGSGKLQEIIVRAMHLGVDAVLFDRELSPSQLRNISEETDLKVLDRTQVILDIFAQHASSREGKLQVELAQLRYVMPRAAIMSTAMSRLTGGIGGRGPGETKLEINKRRAEERLTRLERELETLTKDRATRRKRRQKAELPIVSIVGYTNAGKSTLLNRITNSEVLVENKLFATLDPTSRRFRFPEEREIIVTDTVGFIENLPKTLVAAFRSTLEELEEADLLLHLLDASDPEVESHLKSVETILTDLKLADRPTLFVWNKAEATDGVVLRDLLDRHGGLAVSALTGAGLDVLLDRIETLLFRQRAAIGFEPVVIEGSSELS